MAGDALALVEQIAEDVGTDLPAEAFSALFAKLEVAGVASYDSTSSALVSNARLSVSVATDPSPSLCGPSVAGGYVGYDDQAIRVELRDDNHFTWGFCNAAPIYRVRVTTSDPTRVHFISHPRDGERAPKVGQIVELLPWSAKLPNGEKGAELQGVLARVTTGYNAQSRELTGDLPVQAERLGALQHAADRALGHPRRRRDLAVRAALFKT
jgi:hypothetical protein